MFPHKNARIPNVSQFIGRAFLFSINPGNMIAEQKLRTQRILGQLLKESEVSKTSGNVNQYTKNALVEDNNQGKVKLSDFGITKDQSSTFQKIASLPDEVFEAEEDLTCKVHKFGTSRTYKIARPKSSITCKTEIAKKWALIFNYVRM